MLIIYVDSVLTLYKEAVYLPGSYGGDLEEIRCNVKWKLTFFFREAPASREDENLSLDAGFIPSCAGILLRTKQKK